MKHFTKSLSAFLAILFLFSLLLPLSPVFAKEEETVLRIANWEEYIDEGDWDEDDVIDLESGDIFGENNMIDDFENWYYESYGKKVRVEYSTFGSNEDFYNTLTLGDVYDLVCPSEYMIMKLMAEDRVSPLSDAFFDQSNELNYYIKGVSPYIKQIFESHEINGEAWSKYAAGYMWGVTGFVYNPEIISAEEASTWHLLENSKLARQITVKDNIRDTYFAAVGALKSELLLSESFRQDKNYEANLLREMNDTSPETMKAVQDYLQKNMKNFYAFESDAGKADLITGKVAANLQWSGDGVYTLDEADEEDFTLSYAVPKESTNIYFDGWIMLKDGIQEDSEKQKAAEAFINYISRPDNVIRNMMYVGYTSVIAGSEDGRIMEYLNWNYAAEDDDETAIPYSVALFFTGNETNSPDYSVMVPESEYHRQISAQYPSADVLHRACIMEYFDDEVNARANEMWIQVRCLNIHDVPIWCWILTAIILIAVLIFYFRYGRKIKKN